MKALLSSLLLISVIFSTFPAISQIMFEEKASELGCANTSYGVGTLGGGISFYDFDNDGWDDITISSEEGKPVRIFKNNQGSFTEVDLGIDDLFYETKTVQWVDFDNDGDNDLFVTSHTEVNILYENQGDNTFIDITIEAGLFLESQSSYGASWGDYNNDGFLDVFISSRDVGAGNVLFENNGMGAFVNVTAESGILQENFRSFCSAFFDFNNDGWQDILVANDKMDTKNQLYENNGDGTFNEIGEQAGIDFIMDAMSTTIGDYNQDGWMDFYVTNTYNGNAFFKNNGDGTFTDIAPQNGTLMESWAWGALFLDADNDADVDLYISAVIHNNPNILPAAFYENDGNGNYSIPDGDDFMIEDNAPSFANAIGDINNDGYPDMTVLNYNPDDIFIWKNASNQENNWIKLKLQGVASNRQGIGSLIEIGVNGEKQYNYTNLGEGYLGQNSGFEFFGIGTATQIDYIKVTWLSGNIDLIENPQINTHNLLVEGSNVLQSLTDNFISSIEVLPNPVIDVLNISLVSNFEEEVYYSLYDINGRILTNGKITNRNKEIYFGELTSGLYLLRVNSFDKVYQKKIIKK